MFYRRYNNVLSYIGNAMSDLRKAAEMALESWGFFFSQAHPEIVGLMYGNDWAKIAKERTEALRQALAQPEQEPVGYVTIETISSWAKVPSIKWFKKPTQGPLYTAPPKREWVGLTDEEIEECKINGGLPHAINWRLSVKVMEAKLKEKNT
jgi:hypothetical protein